jgi:hypothetical protein
MHIREVAGDTPNTVNTSVVRTRRYLTAREVEKLIEAARKHGRYGHRDATMILLAYRHGLRASELPDCRISIGEAQSGRIGAVRNSRTPWARLFLGTLSMVDAFSRRGPDRAAQTCRRQAAVHPC